MAIRRDKECHYITLKGIFQQEDITIVNICAPNIWAPKYTKKILKDFKKEIDRTTIIVGDFNTPLPTIDRPSKQKIHKDIVALNYTIKQMDIINIYRIFHPRSSKIYILS